MRIDGPRGLCGILFGSDGNEADLSIEEMMEIVPLIEGCTRYVLQRFQPTKTLDASLLGQGPAGEAAISHIQRLMEAAGIPASVR